MEVRIYGYKEGSTRVAKSEMEVALSDFIAGLQDKGWRFDTTMMDGEPANLQDPDERAAATKRSKETQEVVSDIAGAPAPPVP